jgi:hypothetical protein
MEWIIKRQYDQEKIMGILSGFMGNASEVDAEKLEKDLEKILAEGESIKNAFRLIRDLIVFTDKRLIMIDKQGVTGKKVEYHSIPYKSISHFSVETSGHFDLDAELKIWISSSDTPIEKEFKKDSNIYEAQKTLASFVMK